jgi:hypothetical protein
MVYYDIGNGGSGAAVVVCLVQDSRVAACSRDRIRISRRGRDIHAFAAGGKTYVVGYACMKLQRIAICDSSGRISQRYGRILKTSAYRPCRGNARRRQE